MNCVNCTANYFSLLLETLFRTFRYQSIMDKLAYIIWLVMLEMLWLSIQTYVDLSLTNLIF